VPMLRQANVAPDRLLESRERFVSPVTPGQVRTFWQRHVRPTWKATRLARTVALVIVAATLGGIGFTEAMTTAGQQPSFADLFYRVLNLFRLSGGAVVPPVPWQLDVARFLAPAILAYATFTAVAALLREHVSAFRASMLSGHVVVGGLGPVGARLAESLRRRGYRVVAIARDRANPRISACRELGVIVLVGDESDNQLLRRARVDRAAYLFAATDDDAVNSEIALAARLLAKQRKGRGLTCFVNMHDQTLTTVLKQFAIGPGSDATFRLESLSVAERAASDLLDKFPPVDVTAQTPAGQPHIVVVGASDMASELVLETARRWRRERRGPGDRLRVTVVGDVAEERMTALVERYPQLKTVSDITLSSMSLDSGAFASANFLRDEDGALSVTGVYVCVGDDARGLSAGIHLRNRLDTDDIPIVVCTETKQSGVASLLHGEVEGEVHGRIAVFGLLDCLDDSDRLLRGNNERVAQAIHADYVEQESARGATRETNAAAVPWNELDLANKESNRRAAADVGRKLKAINRTVVPLTDWDKQPLEFTPEEVEALAKMEHDRWWEWRKVTGWRPGPRDNTKHQHPDMIAYEELSEPAKDRDRIQVQRIPIFLAALDFKVVPREKGAPGG
jgi:hypothetical protein